MPGPSVLIEPENSMVTGGAYVPEGGPLIFVISVTRKLGLAVALAELLVEELVVEELAIVELVLETSVVSVPVVAEPLISISF